jgi:hypothetical protein
MIDMRPSGFFRVITAGLQFFLFLPLGVGAAQFIRSSHRLCVQLSQLCRHCSAAQHTLCRALPCSAAISLASPRSGALFLAQPHSAALSRALSRSVALSRAQPCSDVLGMKSGLFGAEPCTAAPPHDCAPLSRIQRRDRALFPRFASYLLIMPGVDTVTLHNFGRVFCYCGSIAVLLRNTSASSPS